MSQYAPKFFPGQTITMEAGADIAGGQALVVNSSGKAAPSSGESPAFIGVAVSDVKSGQPVAIYRVGVHRLTAAGAITAGGLVKTGSSGKVAAATDQTAATAESTASGTVDVPGEAQSDVPLDIDVTTTVDVAEGDAAQAVVIGVALTTAAQDGDEVLVALK